MPEIMTPNLHSFSDELVKTAISPLVKEMAKSTLLGMGFEALLNRDATPLSTIREGAGFGIGDVGATALARGLGFGRLGQFAAGMIGGNALADNLRKRFADKPIRHAIDKLPDTPEFKAIKQASPIQQKMAAAVRSILTPQSSNVSGYSYDPATSELNVTFKGGGTYKYKGVTPKHAKALGRNKSVGKTINKLIKPNYEYEKTAMGLDIGAVAGLTRGRGVGHGGGRKPPKPIGHPTTKTAASGKLLEEILEAIKIRQMRGPHVRDVGARTLRGAVSPPPIPRVVARRAGNVLAPVAGEIKKTAMLRERIREGAPSIVGRMYTNRRSMMKAAGEAKCQKSFDGLPLKIEQEPGDTRTGTAKDGTNWSRKMYACYGYVPGTKGMGADGDAIDVYLSADPVPGSKVYQISQNKKDGGFDEHKYMLGYPSEAAAKTEYLRHMPEWAFGSMKTETMDEFRDKYGKAAA